MNALFSEVEESTSADFGAATTTETTSTDGNAQMPQPDSSETIGTDKEEAVTTNEAALADNDKSQEDEDNGTTAAVHEVKVETKKTIKNRNKRQRKRANAKAKAKESGSKTTVGNTSKAAPTQSDSDSLIDALTSGDCLCCGNVAWKICAKCQKSPNQISYYCSMKCWDKHLSVHDQICSLVKPQKMYTNNSVDSADQFKSVYGIFLAEAEGAKVAVVDVKMERKQDLKTSQYFYNADSSEYLGLIGYPNFITANTLKPNRAVPNFFTVFYLPDELLPQDKELDWNECVNIICGGEEAEDWDGPILIVKYQGNNATNFNHPIDVDLSDDFIDIIDYFKSQHKSM